MDSVLTRFKEKLEKQVKVPLAKDKSSFGKGNPRPVRYAGGYQYIGMNQKIASYIVIDVDRPISMLEIHHLCLPLPTIAVYGVTGKPHLFYELTNPVLLTEKARRGPIKLLDILDHELTTQLGGDTAFSGMFCKNPLCKANKVATYDISYTMAELALMLCIDVQSYTKKMKSRRVLIDAEGRNKLVFDATRLKAYRMIRQYQSPNDFADAVNRISQSFNDPINYSHLANTSMLDSKEVNRISNNIQKWVWKNRSKFLRGDFKNRGVLGYESRHDDYTQPYLSPDEVRARQQDGALYSARMKANESRSKVESARLELNAKGINVSAMEIAKLTGLHRNTVSRYL